MRWGFVFVACPLPLSEPQRLHLVRLAATAWFEDLPEIRFDDDGMEGVVRVAGEVTALGSFAGQVFTAEVNLPDRSGRVQFLVAEQQLRRRDQPIGEA
jgi:hypothetical protein